jgi:hypothetical protein
MLAALEYAGYEVDHCWHKDAGHDDGHGPAIFPDAIRWLWKDYPAPIRAGVNSRQPVMRILIPGEGWKPAGAASGALAAGPDGGILFAGGTGRGIFRIGADGGVSEVASGVDGVTDLSAGADGCVEACQPGQDRIISLDAAGRMTVAVSGIAAWSQCAAPGGGRYVAEPSGGAVWLIGADGSRRVVAREVPEPRCVRLTHDGSGLIVTDGRGRTAHLFATRRDGGLEAPSPFFLLHLPGESAECGAAQVAPFNEAWTCFATALGLQLCTAQGSTFGIIPPPGPGPVTGVAFGGPDRCDLHVACGGKLYRRKINPAADVWC